RTAWSCRRGSRALAIRYGLPLVAVCWLVWWPLLALHGHELVRNGTCVKRQAMNMANRPQPGHKFRLDIELEEREHLRITILLYNVHAIMVLDEVMHFPGEWVRSQPQIVCLYLVFIAQLVASLDDCPV